MLCATVTVSHAASYRCDTVERAYFDPHGKAQRATAEHLAKAKAHVIIEEDGPRARVSRCSWSAFEGKIVCDTYTADQVVLDPNIGAKKFYFFRSQFDVQVFRDLTFIENNGRGQFSLGKCQLTSP